MAARGGFTVISPYFVNPRIVVGRHSTRTRLSPTTVPLPNVHRFGDRCCPHRPRGTCCRDDARRAALNHLLQTFFDGSAESAVVALLQMSNSNLSPTDFERLAAEVRK